MPTVTASAALAARAELARALALLGDPASAPAAEAAVVAALAHLAGAALGRAPERLLAAARSATGPLLAKVLCRRAGLTFNSHSRATLAALVRRGRLVKVKGDGYAPSDGPEGASHVA